MCDLEDVRDFVFNWLGGCEGFYVTSYQANFVSHHTRDHHVGFLFCMVWYWKSQQNVLQLFVSPERSSERDYVITDSVRSM